MLIISIINVVFIVIKYVPLFISDYIKFIYNAHRRRYHVIFVAYNMHSQRYSAVCACSIGDQQDQFPLEYVASSTAAIAYWSNQSETSSIVFSG